MDKPTIEEIEGLLADAKVVGGHFARLAAAYRAKCEEVEGLSTAIGQAFANTVDAMKLYEAQRARAEMLERQYGEILRLAMKTTTNIGRTNIGDMQTRHAAEREG